ncbi:MAG: adenylate cyclase [Paraglaciecola sp.]|jgi:adenylate cyclase
MLSRMLHAWIWCGISPSLIENINPVRICNIITLMVIFVLALQIPMASYYWQQGGNLKLSLLLTHMFFLLCVPLLNHAQFTRLAKLTLVLVFTSYVLWSCWLWQANIQTQYFLLLGLFVCPFIFEPRDRVLMWCCIGLDVSIFIAIEGYYLLLVNAQNLSEYLQVVAFSNSVFLAFSSTLIGYHVGRNVNRNHYKLLNARQRSEQLLLNILPLPIANRLKNNERRIADHYEQVSICFVDLANFTLISKQLNPHQLVALLDDIFLQFDEITRQNGLEKIKTMGDGYMAAAGVPKENPTHALQCCMCALAFKRVFLTLQKKHKQLNGIRIGIGTGEVIAGVIGQTKFCYDLWGEAVTLASRMESHGEEGKIQVTQFTYEMAKHKYNFAPRGRIAVKGIGAVETYWLLGSK